MCVFPTCQWRSLRELHSACWSTVSPFTGCNICRPMMLSNLLAFGKDLHWLELLVQDLGTGEWCCRLCLVGSPQHLHLTTHSGNLWSAGKSAVHTIAAAKNTRVQKFCLSIKSCRASCKALRLCFQGSRVREQHHFFAFLLVTGWPRVLCIAGTAVRIQSVLYLVCILRCCAFCGNLVLSFPDAWSSIPSLFLPRQHEHCIWQPDWGYKVNFLQQAKEGHLSWDFDIKL